MQDGSLDMQKVMKNTENSNCTSKYYFNVKIVIM